MSRKYQEPDMSKRGCASNRAVPRQNSIRGQNRLESHTRRQDLVAVYLILLVKPLGTRPHLQIHLTRLTELMSLFNLKWEGQYSVLGPMSK